jgi:hypothetical protein
MRCLFKRDSGVLTFGNNSFSCICDVRTIANGRRKLSEKPVYSENSDGTKGVPYDPKLFPLGIWDIISILPKNDPYEAPFFISTNAHQLVDVWDEVDGHYGEPIGHTIEDHGYGFHNSTSSTTLGCGRILSPTGLVAFMGFIKAAWTRKEETKIEVV